MLGQLSFHKPKIGCPFFNIQLFIYHRWSNWIGGVNLFKIWKVIKNYNWINKKNKVQVVLAKEFNKIIITIKSYGFHLIDDKLHPINLWDMFWLSVLLSWDLNIPLWTIFNLYCIEYLKILEFSNILIKLITLVLNLTQNTTLQSIIMPSSNG